MYKAIDDLARVATLPRRAQSLTAGSSRGRVEYNFAVVDGKNRQEEDNED